MLLAEKSIEIEPEKIMTVSIQYAKAMNHVFYLSPEINHQTRQERIYSGQPVDGLAVGQIVSLRANLLKAPMQHTLEVEMKSALHKAVDTIKKELYAVERMMDLNSTKRI